MFGGTTNQDARRVFLVEDSRAMQDTLTAILGRMSHLRLVGVAETAGEALDGFTTLQPDLVVLDLALREGSGLDVLQAIKRRRPECQVFVFTSHDSEPYRARCLAAGADRFYSKARQHRELIDELRIHL